MEGYFADVKSTMLYEDWNTANDPINNGDSIKSERGNNKIKT